MTKSLTTTTAILTEVSSSTAVTWAMREPIAVVSGILNAMLVLVVKRGANKLRRTKISIVALELNEGVPPSEARRRS